MNIKVCGMREAGNIADVANLDIDYIGFIFYDMSPRCAVDVLSAETARSVGDTITTVGVFVNSDLQECVDTAEHYGLNAIQLHGNEPVQTCRQLRNAGFIVIKAISIADVFPQALVASYADVVDYFLFDTKTPGYGGSGQQFNWDALESYDMEVPFFLSGGLGPDNLQDALSLKHPMLHAIDLNSQFEISPGLKDVGLLEQYLKTIDHAISR